MVASAARGTRLVLCILSCFGGATRVHASCSSPTDCSLGGECVNGSCICDLTWRGPTCTQLNLLPANRSEGLHQASFASWGGLPVEEDGKYHLFFADFTRHCGLGTWGTNSQLARAVSDTPAGPYKKVEVVAEPFHHNPTIARAPDGTLVLMSIGNGSSGAGRIPPPAAQNNCTEQGQVGLLGDPALAGTITMRYSKSVLGPWTLATAVSLEPGPTGSWDDFVTNPSIYFFPNGTGLMAYRGGPCLSRKDSCNAHHCAIATASSWNLPFHRIGDQPAWSEQTEDPGIFRDARGNFHALTHLFDGGPGGHSFSEDGLSWTFAGQAYDFEVIWEDGSKEQLARRERPQVLMVDGKPAVLFTGAQPKDGLSYTLAQRIAT